jgi:hypothetical protein
METLMDITMIVDALFWLAGVGAGGFLAYGGWLCLVQHFTFGRKRARTSEKSVAAHDWHVIDPS